MTPVAAPEQDTESTATTAFAKRMSQHRLAAGLASGVLLWTSFPPVEWSWLAWLALVPFLWLATTHEADLKTYFAAWAGGLVFWLLALKWVRLSDPSALLGWCAMALIFSLWWPATLALVRWSILRLAVPLIVAAPIVWVGGEFLRAYFLTGFPWYYLAHSQFRHIFVIQIADFTGSLGVSFLVVVVNAFVVDLLSLPLFRVTKTGVRLTRRQNLRLCLVTVLLGATCCYGAIRVSSSQFRDGPKLALLQSNIEQKYKMKADPNTIVARFAALVERAVVDRESPDLIVWPETSYPWGFIAIDPKIDEAELDRQLRSMSSKKIAVETWIESKKIIDADLHRWTDSFGVPMLVGATFYDHRPDSLEKYNSAILFYPHAPAIYAYHKMHLVPFGEYVPFIDVMPWLSIFTPYHGERIPRLSFGSEAGKIPLKDLTMAVTICFEDTVPQVVSRFFGEHAPGREPDMLINLSNDGWFHGSEELDMHLAIGVFRAVEHRVPLARAVNTGLSALVDGNGEIRAFLPKDTEGVLSVTVPLDDRRGLYSRFGDWLGLSCLAVTIGFVPLGIFRKLRGPRPYN